MSEVVLREVRDNTLVITLNRPEARNAVNGALARGVEEALDELDANHELWCAILASNGTAFCAGADLKEIAAGNGSSLSTKSGGFAGVVNRERRKPLIAAVDGPALAGGTEIVLSCDLVVASRRSSFGLPEVKRSLVAGAGGLFRLPRLLPKSIAFEMLLTGDPITSERAYHYGLINHLVEDGDALDGALELARRITVNAPIAVWETYGVARREIHANETELFEESSRAMSRVMKTEDFREGPLAFIEKRPPRWKGK